MDTQPAPAEHTDALHARIRTSQLNAFEKSLRDHLENPPTTWTVAKKSDRCWAIVDVHGTPRTATATPRNVQPSRPTATASTTGNGRTAPTGISERSTPGPDRWSPTRQPSLTR